MPFPDPSPIREPQPELDAERLGLSDIPAGTSNHEPSCPSAPSNRILIVLGLAFAIAGLATALIIAMIKPNTPAAANAELGLRVERNAGQLSLSWNPYALNIAKAQGATLSITDGDHRADVDLNPAQLRVGSVNYPPAAEDVTFRLEVVNAAGERASGSVRITAGQASSSER